MMEMKSKKGGKSTATNSTRKMTTCKLSISISLFLNLNLHPLLMKLKKQSKIPGADEITAELIKNGGPNIEAFYHKLCCKVWNDQKWPADWVKSVFVPIPKKGDTLQCTNNRTIVLISHSSKILLKIIAKRMHWKMKADIAEEQAGFRAGRGTRNQILNLKMVIEKNCEHNKDLFLCFVDYTKAFDTVAHDIIWKNMQDKGFPEHIILLLKWMYSDQKAAVRTTY